MSDLTIKKIKGTYNTETTTYEQIRIYKRHRKEFNADLTGIYIHEDLTLSIIMDCRTPTPNEFGSKLGFDQHDLIMTKVQSVLTKVLKIFAREKTVLQHLLLNYRTDLYFPDHKLGIEADEK